MKYFCRDFCVRHQFIGKHLLGREIADVLLAVNREYGRTDYIPCIVWGRNARCVSKFEVGNQVQITGRIQSREYDKKELQGIVRKRACEVSGFEIMKVK